MELLNIFVNKIQENERDNIISIFLTGGFARGEAIEGSDLDVWCIFNTINNETLSKIGLIIQNLPIKYNDLEINSQCLTIEEFNSGYFSKFLAYPIIHFEGILLFGNDIAITPVKNEMVIKIYKEFFAEVLMSIRHYISVSEPTEKLSHKKIKTWVLKPLMFALRLERYTNTNYYPLTCNDLEKAYNNPLISIEYYLNKEKWDNDIFNDSIKTLYFLHSEVENLLKNG